MKREEKNNEMDLLLRRLGRGSQESAFQGDGHAEHLDADELSSYAENVLPAAARTRYTEHLAECGRCRELVVRLSSSVGVVAAESSNIAAPSGLRKFLASLFSPLVLRYAVPALGLVIVAVIGLVVSKQQGGNHEVAMQAPQPEKPASITNEQAGDAKLNAYDSSGEKKPEADKAVPRANGSPEATAAAPTPEPTPGSFFKIVPLERQTKTNIPFAKEEVAAAKPSVAADEAKQKADDDPRKQATVVAANEPPKQVDLEKAKTEDQPVAAAPAASTGRIAELRPLRPQARAATRRDSDEEKDKKNDAETRTVSGRRFRKEGGVWIDTAYDSSRSPITLTRGSEQYRALIADEPAIKNIAEQLDGEVIVVWKGRTYQIR